MRGLLFVLALAAVALAGCREEAGIMAAGAPVPAGYRVTERTMVDSLAACEARVKDMTKGGQIEPQAAGEGTTTYLFTLNTGRRIWQSCSVEGAGKYVHVLAVSDEVIQ